MSGACVPGPICSSRVGDDWIDEGTMCRAQSSAPGPVGIAAKAKVDYDRAHTYSLAPEAARKRAIDLQIIGCDYARRGEIRLDNAAYLKQLIALGSGGKQSVGSGGGGDLQFFIVRGGAEGLDDRYDFHDRNAGHYEYKHPDDKEFGAVTGMDFNDLIAVFDGSGNFVASALLERPTHTDRISSATLTAIYDAWDGKNVHIYRNHGGRAWVPYVGLGVEDGWRDGKANRGRRITVDLHKQEETLGCIFIVDKATPSLSQRNELGAFEPELIRKVAAAKGLSLAKVERPTHLGVMHTVVIGP